MTNERKKSTSDSSRVDISAGEFFKVTGRYGDDVRDPVARSSGDFFVVDGLETIDLGGNASSTVPVNRTSYDQSQAGMRHQERFSARYYLRKAISSLWVVVSFLAACFRTVGVFLTGWMKRERPCAASVVPLATETETDNVQVSLSSSATLSTPSDAAAVVIRPDISSRTAVDEVISDLENPKDLEQSRVQPLAHSSDVMAVSRIQPQPQKDNRPDSVDTVDDLKHIINTLLNSDPLKKSFDLIEPGPSNKFSAGLSSVDDPGAVPSFSKYMLYAVPPTQNTSTKSGFGVTLFSSIREGAADLFGPQAKQLREEISSMMPRF